MPKKPAPAKAGGKGATTPKVKSSVPATLSNSNKEVTAGGFDYSKYAQHKQETKASELSIPFLLIMQPLSPQVQEEVVPGIKAGDYYNSVTSEVWPSDPGLPFQPVFFSTQFVEWIKRENGGGRVGSYDPSDPFILSAKRANGGSVIGLTNGENDIIETTYAYGNILSQDGANVEGFAVLPVKSTSLKPCRDWRTSMEFIRGKPPYFAFRTLLSATKEKNDQGTWWQFKPRPFGENWHSSLVDPVAEASLMEAGAAFYEMVVSGAAKADFRQEQDAAGAADDGAGGADAPM